MPVYSFGENELFKQVIFSEGSLGRRLQDLFKNIMGFAPCLFVGECLAFLPHRSPVTTIGEYFIILQINLLCCTESIFNHKLSSFQWEAPSPYQSASHLLRRRLTTTIDFTWRPCPSYSMNTRSAVDSLRITSSGSFRHFTAT